MTGRVALLLGVAALAAVLLLLTGCSTPAPPARIVVQPRPALDQSLAAPCVLPARPADLADYDLVDDWLMHQVLPAFADCARRLAELVKASGN